MARRRNGYPLKIERSYYRDLAKMVRSWQQITNRVVDTQIKKYFYNGTKVLTDADNSDNPEWLHAVQIALNLLSIEIEQKQPETSLNSITTRFVYAVNQFSYSKIVQRKGIAQMKVGILAINPLRDNAKLREYTMEKIIENTNLIKTLRQRYIDQTKADIYRIISNGGGVSDLAHSITSRTGMALRHADLIATDQTGKILSQIDAYRNQATGSTRYIWRSMEDKRVRPKHRELDGKEFKYDDPNGGDNGQLPGQPIRCRCYQDPID
ncbi:phage minor head protein [Lactobacillus helveticus]|uniref:phage minor head protein n=1 Tax=Lactobacillus helveticus TaxID=1587 RepID=UPI00062AA3F2|nr:phage minor head protein [Lactobacillus helveticus]AKG66640.1 phage head morphogenesis protein [Lactobacillus helveticus]